MNTNYTKEINEISEIIRKLEGLKLDIQDKEKDLHRFNKLTQQCNESKRELYNLKALLANFN